MTDLHAGLLGPAIRWSWAGLGLGVAVWITLLAWSVGESDDVRMSNPFHRLVVTSAAILILGSLMVQLAARLIRGQRRIKDRLDKVAVSDPHVVQLELAMVGMPDELSQFVRD